MELTREQEAAVDSFGRWLSRRDRPWFHLAGYAGTGKTTIARRLADAVGGRVEFGAPTGKAAQVLRRKGCEGATTLHRLVYHVGQRSQARVRALEEKLELTRGLGDLTGVQRLERELRAAREEAARPSFGVNPDAHLRGASLLVLDEASMVDERLARDVLSFGVPVLALGDPAQLPPVRGRGWFTAQAPDATLVDVQRQAAESSVIRLATLVRRGEPLPRGPLGDSLVLGFSELSADLVRSHAVVLAGHNKTRRALNRRLRALAGHDGAYPRKGEPLIALNNRHDLGVYNGSTLVAASDAEVEVEPRKRLRVLVEGPDLDGPLEVEGDTIAFDRYVDPDLPDYRPWFARKEDVDLDWAYALTVHKSQGSEWSSVLVADDGFARRRPRDRRAWLYTAVTRASDRVTVALS